MDPWNVIKMYVCITTIQITCNFPPHRPNSDTTNNNYIRIVVLYRNLQPQPILIPAGQVANIRRDIFTQFTILLLRWFNLWLLLLLLGSSMLATLLRVKINANCFNQSHFIGISHLEKENSLPTLLLLLRRYRYFMRVSRLNEIHWYGYFEPKNLLRLCYVFNNRILIT
jgi:hypothetical protein